jgi:hypothetical protein
MADFTFFFPSRFSLLKTCKITFFKEFLVFNFAFPTNFASKKRNATQGWMLVTFRKPEKKKGRKKNRYVCMENQKKKKIVNVRCWSLILPSWDIFWPLLKWTLRAQCCCFSCKRSWIAIVEQPDSFLDVLCVYLPNFSGLHCDAGTWIYWNY